MYHTIVRARLRAVFERLNVRDFGSVAAMFGPGAEHSFFGSHALAATRRTPLAITRWYERLERVLPDLRFQVLRVQSCGWPWHTEATVEWRDSGRTLDGQPFANQGVHAVTLRWGRVRSLRVYCDTQMLAQVLARNAASGVAEAAAPPIEDSAAARANFSPHA